MLKVLLVADNAERVASVQAALVASGCAVVCVLPSSYELRKRAEEHAADVFIIDIDSPPRELFRNLSLIRRDRKRPVVIFARDGDREKIREAVRVGVSAYVVDDVGPGRIKPIMEAAIARFEQLQAVYRELDAAEGRLAERKVIERAKGIIMKSRSLDEDDAYRALRRMAMDKKLRISEAARQVVAVSQLLD